jgi:hypothetical protein
VQEYISDSNLEVNNENAVFDAVVFWVEHDYANREQHFKELMSNVNLAHCTTEFLCDTVASQSLVRDHCKAMLEEAKMKRLVASPGDVRNLARSGAAHLIIIDERHNALYLTSNKTWKSIPQFCDYFKGTGYSGLADLSNYSLTSVATGLVLSGGAGSGGLSRACVMFDTVNMRWVMLSDMIQARQGHVSVATENALYVIGGMTIESRQAGIERLEFANMTWKSLITPALKASEWNELSPVVLNNEMYLATNDGQFLKYKDDGVWIDMARPPISHKPQTLQTAAAYGTIMLFDCSDTCYKYNSQMDTWSSMKEQYKWKVGCKPVQWRESLVWFDMVHPKSTMKQHPPSPKQILYFVSNILFCQSKRNICSDVQKIGNMVGIYKTYVCADSTVGDEQ